MALEQELATYERELPNLLAEHEGEYVLIKRDRIDSFWKTEEQAYEAGCERFGVEPFFIERVRKDRPSVVLVPRPVMR